MRKELQKSTLKNKANLMNNINKKFAVITGASSGIGWFISKELANKGYSIIAVSNQAKQLQDLKQELEQNTQIEVLTLEYDLTKTDAAQYVFDFCENKNLSVEVLVNNAGILVAGEVTSITVQKTAAVLNLHMNTPVLLCRLFGEQMELNKKGYILNTASISAVMPYPTISLYGPTKTFLRQFSKAIRIEMKRNNVHVCCLLPGATATPLYDNNVINISLAMMLGIMKQPDYVAKKGVQALFKKKGESIPGLINKITMVFVPLFPSFIIRTIYYIYLKKFKK